MSTERLPHCYPIIVYYIAECEIGMKNDGYSVLSIRKVKLDWLWKEDWCSREGTGKMWILCVCLYHTDSTNLWINQHEYMLIKDF